MERSSLAVERFFLLLTVFIGIVLFVHSFFMRILLQKFNISYYDASYTSGILLLLAMYVIARFSRPMEKQIANFVYLKDKQHYKLLMNEVIRDGLTGLYDHKYFMFRLEEEIEHSKRYLRPISLLMIDIDYFKRYNDSFGHLEGDAILTKLGKSLKRILRKVDICARYGGEEFAIILPETRREGARMMAERLREHAKIIDSRRNNAVTISIGIGFFDGLRRDYSKEELIRESDEALYRAKAAGRDRVEG